MRREIDRLNDELSDKWQAHEAAILGMEQARYERDVARRRVEQLTVRLSVSRVPVFVCGGLPGSVLFPHPFVVLGERWLIKVLTGRHL